MNRQVAREAVRLLEAHQPFVRATVVRARGSVPGKVGASMILRSDGSAVGTVGGASLEEEVRRHAVEAFDSRTGGLYHYDLKKWKPGGLPSLCGGEVDIAVEYVPAQPNLLLWGGGHVAEALARLLPPLEYDYTVADDRPDWVDAARFPGADRRLVVEPAQLFDAVDAATYTHLFLLGYDAAKDLEVLERAIARFPNAIGLISSASKREHMFRTLEHRGVPRRSLDRIHAPIGLPIGAQSPAEIAVAIVAEIVRSQHPLAERTGVRRPARLPPSEADGA